MVKSFDPTSAIASLEKIAIFYTIMLNNYQRFLPGFKRRQTLLKVPGVARSCASGVCDYGKI